MRAPKRITKSNDWWNCTKEGKDHKIQWTHLSGGWVRARDNISTSWEYKQCGNAYCALSTGERMIENQVDKKKR